MQIQLCCSCCECEFIHEKALYRLRDQDRAEAELWADALGDGGTVEDALHAALADGDDIRCPECDAQVPVREEDLGRLAMVMLASW